MSEWAGYLSWVGSVAPTVWVGLSVLLVLALREAVRTQGRFVGPSSLWISALLVAIWLHPVISLGNQHLGLMLVAAGIVLGIAVAAAGVAAELELPIAVMVFPTIAWLLLLIVYMSLELAAR